MFTQDQGVALQGYRWGREILQDHSVEVDKQIKKDPLFMVKFVHPLDVHPLDVVLETVGSGKAFSYSG